MESSLSEALEASKNKRLEQQPSKASPDPKTIAGIVSYCRQVLGLSMHQVFVNGGVSKGTISRIESGQDCTLTTFLKLAKGLGVPASALLAEYEALNPEP